MQCLQARLNECEEVHAAANFQLNYAQRIFRMLNLRHDKPLRTKNIAELWPVNDLESQAPCYHNDVAIFPRVCGPGSKSRTEIDDDPIDSSYAVIDCLDTYPFARKRSIVLWRILISTLNTGFISVPASCCPP